jgi:nitric oxide dioxygenase
MTPDQMRLVRMSCATVMKRKAEAGQTFYRHLFAIAPDLRPMFKSDIDAQADKFVEMLALIVSLLHSPADLSHT